MEDVDVVVLHACRERLLEVIAVTVGDRGQLFVANHVLKNEFIVVERVVVQTSLSCDQVGDGLSVLPGNDRVVQLEVVKRLRRVLEVELNHFNGVGECVERHFSTLCDGNELIFILFDAMTREEGKRLQVALEGILSNEVLRAQACHLVIEELSRVEHSLLLFARHPMEQVGVIGVLNEIDATVCVFIIGHVSEGESLLLLRANPSGEGVAHHEDREVFLDLEVFVLNVRHGNHERRLVSFAGNCNLRVTW